jgi:hypothetical protein
MVGSSGAHPTGKFATEQVFDRENAVEYYTIFAVEYGLVKPVR